MSDIEQQLKWLDDIRDSDEYKEAALENRLELLEEQITRLHSELEQAREALGNVTYRAGAEDLHEYDIAASGMDFASYEQGFDSAVKIIRRRCEQALKQQEVV